MNDSTKPAAAETEAIEPNIAALLAEAGRPTQFTQERLPGGRNIRTYRVRTGAGDSLLKWYFSHQSDRRDRLGTEFNFCRCLWQHGIRLVPQPFAADRKVGLGMYEFLPGRPLTPADIDLDSHRQAIAFVQRINTVRHHSDALSLANGSESCFSLAAHLDHIDSRLQRLAMIPPDEACNREIVEFIQTRLQPAFEQQRSALEAWATTTQLDMHAEVAASDRCLSPSDFGFHNALLQTDGTLRFVDFEYAGWDDPAKLVSDFFCQIEVPALAHGFDEFLDCVARLSTHSDEVVQRTRRLLPLYQIKWCCIVLNEFLPGGLARRSFNDPRELESRRVRQLALARRLYDRIGC